MIKVKRYFLELDLKKYKEVSFALPKGISINIETKKNPALNKFFYKQIGSDHHWKDRLAWSERDWKTYISNKNLHTGVIRHDNDLIGYYEVEFHMMTKEVELINMGVLKEFRGKKLGSLLLNHVIKFASAKDARRLWVHTCSLDHKNALLNYKSKGFEVFKEEEVNYVA